MIPLLILGLGLLGFAASFRPLLWLVIAAFAVGVAAENWSGGAYSDSGGEIWFSAAIVGTILAIAALGWAIPRLSALVAREIRKSTGWPEDGGSAD